MDKPTLLIVDDEPDNLKILNSILGDNYRVLVAPNGEVAVRIAVSQNPNLILLDIVMPGMDGYEVCRLLQSNPKTKKIPILFATAKDGEMEEEHGLKVGAVDYITKPYKPPVIRARVQTHLQLVRVEALDQFADDAVFMLGEAGHYNDNDTGLHIWRMAAYAELLARANGWSKEAALILRRAAPMHDTGKIGIPDEILKAPRPLTPAEWVIMRTHCRIGYDILCRSDHPVFKMAADIALCHHEKWNGSGYPQGLTGEAIPISARIVAVCDVFDALTMQRPYKEAWSIEAAMQEIKNSTGSHFDPHLVNLFFEIEDQIVGIKQKWDTKEASHPSVKPLEGCHDPQTVHPHSR
ncbi:HD domain-containing phosphohydrolase [Acanthopleuribacter pedis]|uniref:HD domain-containing phosphohydrolase n=1 Tax=Acanthopleuribacter pedis TaxID=442870 RepID=UPI003C6F53F4